MCGQICVPGGMCELGSVCVSIQVSMPACVCVCASKPVCPPAWPCVVVIVCVLADGFWSHPCHWRLPGPAGGHCPGPLPPAVRDEGQREGRVSSWQVLLPGDYLCSPCQGPTWLESTLPPPLLLRALCVLTSTREPVTCLRGQSWGLEINNWVLGWTSS